MLIFASIHVANTSEIAAVTYAEKDSVIDRILVGS